MLLLYPILHEICFPSIFKYHLRYVPTVYRLIDASLVGNIYMIPLISKPKCLSNVDSIDSLKNYFVHIFINLNRKIHNIIYLSRTSEKFLSLETSKMIFIKHNFIEGRRKDLEIIKRYVYIVMLRT